MKSTFCTIAAAVVLLLTGNVQAQTAVKDTSKKHTITISNEGIFLTNSDTSKAAKAKLDNKIWTTNVVMDLGTNFLVDNTNYNDPGVNSYLSHIPETKRNADLFSLRQSKSINVNLYWLRSFKALNTKNQRIIISSGLGLQLYNFRFDNNITYTRNPSSVIIDTIGFTKNKLGLDYLNVPLMVTFKTRIHQSASGKKGLWLVYGAGITAGYNISTWTKQKSAERGKVKMHDDFNFNSFNSCVTAEIGIDSIIRLYGSYQLTSLYNNGIDQHPVSIGIKILGI